MPLNDKASWKAITVRGWLVLILSTGLLRCSAFETNRVVTITTPTNTNTVDCGKEWEKAQKGEAEALVNVAKHCSTNTTEQFNCYRRAAEQGNRDGQFGLADCYANGDGVARDVEEATKWYRKAAEGGPAWIQLWVANIFLQDGHNRRPMPPDRREGLKWMRASADQGNAAAQYELGTTYLGTRILNWRPASLGQNLEKNEELLVKDGSSLSKEETEGVEWLRRAAEQGNSAAYSMLAMVLCGTAEGVKWLRKSCEHDYSLLEGVLADPEAEKSVRMVRGGAFCALACHYDLGNVVPRDEAEALKWYRRAAELGSAFGQFSLGRMLEEGKATAKDPAEAAKWYRKSADQDEGYGQIALGKLYAEGTGVRLDGFEAIKWYQRAADKGLNEALVGIAEVWAFGKGVPKSTSEAIKWYKQAAEKGNALSQFNLGVFYSKGEGVPLDYIEAYKWYNLAAANGYDKADKLRDSLAPLMTREQIAEAQRRASEFLAKKQRGSQSAGGGDSTPADLSTAEPKASGSGFFITEDGYLLTNAHVVEEAARLVVRTRLGTFPASLVKADSVNDIALLKVSGEFHSLPVVSSRTVKLGDTVFTIGFPNPQLQGIEPKLTDGKVSSLAGAQDDARHFQISAAVQPGNSGGALVDSVGNVVGIVTARLSEMAALKTSGALPQNVNYAIKSSYVLGLLESLPEVANKLKEPRSAKERKFEDIVKEAQEAAALVLAY